MEISPQLQTTSTPSTLINNMAESSEHTHELVGIGSLLFVIIILFTLCASKIISVFRLHYLNESTISIVLGLIIGIIIKLFSNSGDVDHFSFDSEFFFFVLLPPIVFEAGFSLKRKHFFHNVCTILMYAVIGTMISSLVIAYGLYLVSWTELLPLYNNGDPLECLLFGALISAVDPVGTLSVLGRKELNVDPTLYSLIFGESVLNDAVSIVFYKILRSMVGNEVIISFQSHFFRVIGQFCAIFVASFLIGLIVALMASLILRVLHKSNRCNQARSGVTTREHMHASDGEEVPEIEMGQIEPVITYDEPKGPKHPTIAVNGVNPINDGQVLSAVNAHKLNAYKDENSEDTNESTNSRSPLTTSLCHKIKTRSRTRSRSQDHTGSMPMTRTIERWRDVIYLDEYRHNESEILGENPSMEFSIIILFSYLAYILGEVCSASGIVAVFSCGICMSHYAWYNLSWIAQISLHHIIRGLSKCSENFVYAYLGISMLHQHNWSALLIVISLGLCILARAANIFPLSFLVNTRRTQKVTWRMQIMIFFSSLRGAIAFALALNINTKHSDLIITTTLSIVIITTVFCGFSTKIMLDKLGLVSNTSPTTEHTRVSSHSPESHGIDLGTDDQDNYMTMMRQIRNDPRTLRNIVANNYYGLGTRLKDFDRNVMQKWFGGSTQPLIRNSEIGIFSNRQADPRAHLID